MHGQPALAQSRCGAIDLRRRGKTVGVNASRSSRMCEVDLHPFNGAVPHAKEPPTFTRMIWRSPDASPWAARRPCDMLLLPLPTPDRQVSRARVGVGARANFRR